MNPTKEYHKISIDSKNKSIQTPFLHVFGKHVLEPMQYDSIAERFAADVLPWYFDQDHPFDESVKIIVGLWFFILFVWVV